MIPRNVESILLRLTTKRIDNWHLFQSLNKLIIDHNWLTLTDIYTRKEYIPVSYIDL